MEFKWSSRLSRLQPPYSPMPSCEHMAGRRLLQANGQLEIKDWPIYSISMKLIYVLGNFYGDQPRGVTLAGELCFRGHLTGCPA